MPKIKQPQCKHPWWLYDHSPYQGPNGETDTRVAVQRQCSESGIHQMATITPWRKPFAGYALPELRTPNMIRNGDPDETP